MTRDCTERRAHEDALQQTEQRFRTLIEGVQDYAIFMLDSNGFVTTWNTGAEKLKGYAADEIIGSHFSRFYPQDAIERGWPDHELRMAEMDGRFEDEGWRIRKDGSRFWASVVITALRDYEGALIGFSKITRDLTERKQVERRLAESEEQLRLLVQGITDYAILMLDATRRRDELEQRRGSDHGLRRSGDARQAFLPFLYARGHPWHEAVAAAARGARQRPCVG